MKIAVVTCYDQNDYVRASVLRRAIAACSGVDMLVIRNSHKGLLRYLEVPFKILWARLTQHPDAYVITFRGYEMLLFMVLTFVRKSIIFDEMINLVEYVQEHGHVRQGTLSYKFVKFFHAWQLRYCRFILADTQAHAEFSAGLCNVPLGKFRTVPVGTNEELFSPLAKTKKQGGPFNVFFYGNGMTPLHGLNYMLEAALLLKNDPNIVFNFVGGKDKGEAACQAAKAQGAHIIFERWIPFEEIARRAQTADLTLGGPFGKTLQSQFVVTGKTYQFLAAGAPVVVGKNAVSGLFEDRVNCLLVPPANARALADAVTWAALHPKELEGIAAAGRKLYEQHFSQAVVNGLVQAMAKELEHGRTR
jgi:glycosyltransferase involved in cell wall biosynthesis